MSASSAPISPPQLPGRTPTVVQKRPASPSGRGPWWIVGIILVAAIATGIYLWQGKTAATESAAVARTVRTVTIARGPLDATVRLTGVTGAENFVQLIVPQLRGSRSDSRRGGGAIQAAAALPSLAPAPTGIGPRGDGGSSGGSNISSALRASTSRVGPAASSAKPAATGSTNAASSATMGAEGIGSTGAALNQGGGGGGGGGDFSIVLQKVSKPGGRVKKGETVAEFDRQYMLMRLEDYRAGVVQTQASLLKLKADLTISRHAHEQKIFNAKGALDKAKLDLKTVPVLSNIEAERAKLAVQETELRYNELLTEVKLVEESLNSQIRNAEIELQQSNIELRRAEANAERMIVKTPIDGITVMQTVPRGGELAQIQEGDQLYPGILFMTVVDPRSMIINAVVNQADVERLRLGAKARVRFDAYPGLELTAHIFSVGGIAKPGGQRQSFVKEIPVRLKLDQMDPRVIPDLTVSADIGVGSEPAAPAIAPLASVFRDAPDAAPYVLVKTAGGWARREVQLGLANFVSVAVRAGLKENEIVAMERPPESSAKTQSP